MPSVFKSVVRDLTLITGLVLLYLLAGRLILNIPRDGLGGAGGAIVSFSFLCGLPMCCGVLSCWLGSKIGKDLRFWPTWGATAIMVLGCMLSFLVKLEALLCVIVAMPFMVCFTLLGGWLTKLIIKSYDPTHLQVSVVLLLPFAVAPLEQLWKHPHETVAISNTLHIRADAATVWKHIASVPPIGREELPNQWIYLLDFPRPVSAEIDREGVGAKRSATFERNVSFFETVTVWEPRKRLAFTIEADPAFIPHTAFDQHIIVGGRFYDVLDGTYEIEPLPESQGGGCRLRLTSTHRLSSPFNWYAGLWSEWVMHQIQGSIMEVIRARCERETSP